MQEKRHDRVVEMRLCFFLGKVGDYNVSFVETRMCRSTLNEDVLLSIMVEEKPNQVEKWKIPKNRLKKYFPSGTSQQKMEETIIKALELYRKREKSRER